MALGQDDPTMPNDENNDHHSQTPETKSSDKSSQQIQRIESTQRAIFHRLELIRAKKHHLQSILDRLKECYGNQELDETTDDNNSISSSEEERDQMQWTNPVAIFWFNFVFSFHLVLNK